MAELFENIQKIDNIEIPTKTIEIGGLGVIGVECGTNCPCGGDSGHGGRAYIRIYNATGDADLRVPQGWHTEQNEGAIFELGGDCELDNIADAFLWISRVLKSQSGRHLDRYKNEGISDVGGQKAYNKYEKFYHYLSDLVSHYHWEKSLRNMSDFAKKYHCKGVTKEQFFQNGLHNKLSVTEKESEELYDKIFKSEKK